MLRYKSIIILIISVKSYDFSREIYHKHETLCVRKRTINEIGY